MLKLLLLAVAILTPAVLMAQVEVREGTLDLPTDEEGPPDVNPPFDLFVTRFNYPYTLRDTITGKQKAVRYKTLELENEHLRLVVLPELGGHLYTCVDKSNGAEMFYANRSIRKAQIGYRGAWAAYGVEFNFPVSHNWMSMSPVDYATVRNPDGSASIWVGNVDRPYGMQWRVELRLRPGSALLEQHVALYNRSATRHRFYWWNNAAVRVHDDSRIEYPMRWTASHGFTEVDTWPVDAAGHDLSRVGNHLYGPVSLFSHGSREAFMGVYHPWSEAGVAHYSSPVDAPTKKIWSFGGDADGIDWRRALSDDMSAYVEVQAGLFRNQETYGLLEPQATIDFMEYWMPVRKTGGITRANPEGVLHVERKTAGAKAGTAAKAGAGADTIDLLVGVNVNRALLGGVLRIKDGASVVRSEALDLTPAQAASRVLAGLPAGPRYTVEVAEADGHVRIAHTEGVFDYVPESEIKLGPQPAPAVPPPDQRSDGDFVFLGDTQEREGQRLAAWKTYDEGLARFPESLGLLKAAGRLAVGLRRPAEAVPLLSKALARVSNDAEVQYYLGLAHAAAGDETKARSLWEGAQILSPFRAAARLELVRLDARGGDLARALERAKTILDESPDAVRAGAVEVALLRHLGRGDEAGKRLAEWRTVDPTSNLLRQEAAKLGNDDPALWLHLAGDPERVLDVVEDYMALGFYKDAVELLERRYPTGEGVMAEPGTPAPQGHPLLAYYRGYCREKAGGSGQDDYNAARSLSTRYVFPSRASSFPVLRAALAANANDATAHFLLGSLLLSTGRADDAVDEWEAARRIDPKIPVLHRNLASTRLFARGEAQPALDLFLEGMGVDPTNMALYVGADQAQSLVGRPLDERIRMLERYPDRAAMPPLLVEKLALALAEAGRAEEAEALFGGRFFPREENGTNVRQVWIEVRLRRAQALAKAGKTAEALAVVASLDRPRPGLEFTKDGLQAFIEGSRVQYVIGEIYAACGRPKEAAVHWKRAVDGHDWAGIKPVFAYLAAKRLGTADEAATKRELEASLARSEAHLAGTGFPGIAVYAQGLHLRALGREAEAKERFRRVFLLPDQRLSHFLARRALEGADPL
jgi:tetratricopeptide (TPR) repeat protein